MPDKFIHRVLQWGPPVGAGVTSPTYVTLDGVAKADTHTDGYVVANEFLCNRLALLVGLPAPAGALVLSPSGAPAFVSLRFGPVSSRPPPVIPEHFVEDHPLLSGHIVAFDCWIMNTDRHVQNLSYSRGNLPPTVFDHSHALFGAAPGKGVARVNNLRSQPVIAGCLPPHLNDSAGIYGMGDRIVSLDREIIESLFIEAVDLGLISQQEAADGAAVLIERAPTVATQCEAEDKKFPEIHQWGLI